MKNTMNHQQFLAYLKESVQFGYVTATRFMRAAKEFDEFSPVKTLEPSKVYALLEAPEEDRERLASEAADMTKRELEEAVREANRAKREAEEARKRATEAETRARELASRPPEVKVVEKPVEVVNLLLPPYGEKRGSRIPPLIVHVQHSLILNTP